MKAELASKRFSFMTVSLFEGFVWHLNERSYFCACLCGERIAPRKDQCCDEDPQRSEHRGFKEQTIETEIIRLPHNGQ